MAWSQLTNQTNILSQSFCRALSEMLVTRYMFIKGGVLDFVFPIWEMEATTWEDVHEMKVWLILYLSLRDKAIAKGEGIVRPPK